MSIARLARYWHTLKYLRPVQFYGRVWFRLAHPKPDLRPAPLLRTAQGRWLACARTPSMLSADEFRFLNVVRRMATAGDWNHPAWPKLWLYNAHYFDDLVADGAPSRATWHADLIERWIRENPPGEGNGWEPYPTSLRIANWIKWSLAGNQLSSEALTSLAIQTRYLTGRLEHHLLGNHLWANAKALAFAGAFFGGKEGDRWLARGLSLIAREMKEQFLSDGGHFERSPMYHAILLEDMLDLVQLADRYPATLGRAKAGWSGLAQRMGQWLRVMTHPDGQIAFFNDAAFGISPEPAALATYASALAIEALPPPAESLVRLDASGYIRLEAEGAVVIVDVAPVGPDYLPGHAHADTLSFEASFGGVRAIVNGGTSTYATGERRFWERGTAAHNTVVVDGENSSEVWGGFRVARRARPIAIQAGHTGDVSWVEAAHDGYHRLAGKPTHKRRWELRPGRLTVEDAVAGKHASATARFRLAPSLSPGENDSARHPNGTVVRWEATQPIHAEPGDWAPRFGEVVATHIVRSDLTSGRLTMTFSWS